MSSTRSPSPLLESNGVTTPVHELRVMGKGAQSGFMDYLYGATHRYEPGKVYRVEWMRNDQDPLAIESRLCDADEGRDKSELAHSALKQHFGVQSSQALGDAIRHLTCYTITTSCDGVTRIEAEERQPDLGASLPAAVPRVPTLELHFNDTLGAGVELVSYKAERFAFKRVEFFQENSPNLCNEVRTMFRLARSPFIMDVHAVVVVGGDGSFSGFLTKYAPDGTLDAAMSSPDHSWATRLGWASDVVHGVRDLHSIEAYNGDLKPENVLLVRGTEEEGKLRAVLIDLEASGGWTDEYMAPDVEQHWADLPADHFDSSPRAAWDIYSLGSILWSIAEGKRPVITDGKRPSSDEPLVFTNSDVPGWYRAIATACWASVDVRPTIGTVVEEFARHGLRE